MNGTVIIATFRRNIRTKMRAYPLEFFFSNLMSACFLILNAFFLYKLLFDGNISKQFVKYTSTSDYMSYTIIGCFIYMFIVGAILSVSRSFISEIKMGTLDSILITNMNPVSYLIGNMLEHMATITFELIITFIICIPFGLNLANINILPTIIYFFVSIIGTFGLVVIVCGIMVYFRDTFIIQNTIFAFISLLCGVSFPIEYLPNCVQHISKLIPVTYSLKLLRGSILNGQNTLTNYKDFTWLIILSIVYCIIGISIMNKILYRAVENQFI